MGGEGGRLRVCYEASCPQGGSERWGTPGTSELSLRRAEGDVVFTYQFLPAIG